MKLFGEYLVEKSLINHEVLVDSLIEQVRELPPVSEVVRRQKLLGAAEILQVFKHETENGLSFVGSARALQLWSQAIEKSVNSYLKSVRVPIGQILVRRGAIDSHKMTMALDDFLGERATAPASPVAPSLAVSPSSPVAPASASPISTSSSAPNEFSKEKLKSIAQFFDGMVMSPPKAEELKSALEELHMMRSLARFSSASRLEALIVMLEEITEMVQRMRDPDIARYANLAVSGAEAVQVIRAVALVVNQDGKEEGFFSDGKSATSYDEALAVVTKVRDEFKTVL